MVLMENENFFTFSEYLKKENNQLTASMEDYLEMIFRLSKENGFTRIHEVARALNVQPSSVTKMVRKLSLGKLVKYEKYSTVILTEEGKVFGNKLLKRHNTILGFLQIIGVKDGLLKETEAIEHTVDANTLKHLEDFMEFIESRHEIMLDFYEFKAQKIKKPDEG